MGRNHYDYLLVGARTLFSGFCISRNAAWKDLLSPGKTKSHRRKCVL